MQKNINWDEPERVPH